MAKILLTGNTTSVELRGTAPGAAHTFLTNGDGGPALQSKGVTYDPANDGLMPIGGVNDGLFRVGRFDRSGGLSIARYTPMAEYFLFTAALPPTWLAPATTMTVTHNISSGSLLNASGIGTLNTNIALVSMQAVPKTQRAPIFARFRARLIKGATNGAAEIGFTTTQTPGSAVNPNGFFFIYGADGSLRPAVSFNSNVTTGNDFSASIDSTRYYTWEIILDDNGATFIVQDSSTGAIVTDQSISIAPDAGRYGQLPFLFAYARTYVGGIANAGLATQLFMSDASIGILDVDSFKPWAHSMSTMGKSVVINPTAGLTQLENYSNSAAPASATLSNTAAGYTTLGGQFQFAAIAGAETDYALFAFTVPTGVKLIVTGIRIETFNLGAAVATTGTLLQWFASADSAAATLASNTFRKSLGVQSFPVGAAIGAIAAPIDCRFQSPLVTNSGRIFHVGLKMPVGTATASQIIRGVVQIEGYFE